MKVEVAKTPKLKAKKAPESSSVITIRWVFRVLLVLWAILIVFPLLWAIMTSFKNKGDVMQGAFSLPTVWRFSNYAEAWNGAQFGRYFLNTLILSAGSVCLCVLMVLGSSYVIAKYHHFFFRLLDHFYSVFMMVPQMLLLIPLYQFCYKLHLLDGWWVIPTLMLLNAIQGVPFYVFLTLPFMRGINNDILEAAEIDGANEFQRFFRVVLPMVKPPLFIVALLSFTGVWNEYAMSITFIEDKNFYTMSAGLNELMADANVDFGVKFAALIISMIPVVIMYAIFQKPLQNGLSASDGVKG